ncbi:hypothetical protein K457DRAFT_124009 [Linnemannia elongata AG-77]|uniref:BHLH domain-containing protein n=1 Tax=Linnemannia elongata AG-77 TaxID=1314771 RepID=A0A197K2N8_9FUNG|nr:hypothetical protein K457DRAFT_124009 [Linnemannia elongata AG-77]
MDIDALSSSTTSRHEMTAQTTIPPKQRKPYTKSSTSASSSTAQSKPNSRGVRMTFELDDVLRKYTPEEFKTCKGYDVGGVNILNKKPLDSKTALDKITRRRETHNRVERRRRDCINQLIDELTDLLPKEEDDSLSKGHRVNILRNVVSHIQTLTRHNENLNQQLQALQSGSTLSPPTIITTPAPPTIHFGSNDRHVSDVGPPSSPSYIPYDSRSHSSPQSTTSSPQIGPSYQHPEHHHYFTPLQPPGSEPFNTSSTSDSSRAPSPSLPSLNDMAVTLPAIPKIVEPLDSSFAPLDQDQPDTSSGSYSKRMNRQTLPRLQLLPPPFNHGRSNSTSSHLGSPSSPSYHGHPSPSPTSAYSGYSSTSGPWSSTSSSYGPLSPSGSIPYSPSGPTSPYGPSSATLSSSPSGFSPHPRSPMHSPGLSPWDMAGHGAGGVEEQSLESNGWCSTSHLQQHSHPYKSDRHPEVS